MVFIRLNSGSTVPNLQAGGVVQRTEAAGFGSQDGGRISAIQNKRQKLRNAASNSSFSAKCA